MVESIASARSKEWFARYLQGELAAKWITDGQPALERLALVEAIMTP